MAEANKLSVTVSAEKLIHTALIEAVEKAMNDHGIQVIGVSFGWALNLNGTGKVFSVEMKTHSMAQMKSDDATSMN